MAKTGVKNSIFEIVSSFGFLISGLNNYLWQRKAKINLVNLIFLR